MKYQVRWETEVEAENPNHAVKKAQKSFLLGTFDVLDKDGNKVKVNLGEKSYIPSEIFIG